MSEGGEIPWVLDPTRAALLVVDMQNDFVNEGAIMEVPMARQRIPNMARLIGSSRTIGVPVLFTSHVLYNAFDVSPLETAYQPKLKREGMRAGGEGVEIVDALRPLGDEIVIRKHRYDAFYNTRLESVLRNIRGPGVVDTLIIVGTVTSICCESTARSAFMRDFKVVMVSDANGDLDQASHDATLRIIGLVFGRVMTTDEVLLSLRSKVAS